MKRYILPGILTAAVLIVFGSSILTGLSLFDDPNFQDEAPAGAGALLLTMLPLDEDYPPAIEYLIEREQPEKHSWLPEDFSQGSPPENLQNFELPAALYEGRRRADGDHPGTLTIDLEESDPGLSGDDLTDLLEVGQDSYYYLWLPLKEVRAGSRQAKLVLDPEAHIPASRAVALDAGNGETSVAIIDYASDERTYEIVISKITREEEIIEPVVGLYAGEGSWETSVEALKNFLDHYGIDWRAIDEQDAANMSLEKNFDLLLFPGGSSTEYASAIQDHHRIREFVDGGGRYIGICAGAYFATDVMLWDNHATDHPLDLFPGLGIWPVPGHIGWGQKTPVRLDGSHPVNEAAAPQSPFLDMYYLDGPYFSPYDGADHHVEIIARYAVNDKPSAVAVEAGRGKALLLGMHPELGFSERLDLFTTGGEEGAHWDWLHAAFMWILQ